MTHQLRRKLLTITPSDSGLHWADSGPQQPRSEPCGLQNMGSDARKSLQVEDPGCRRAAPPYPAGVGATRSAHHWQCSQAVAYTSQCMCRSMRGTFQIQTTQTLITYLPIWLLNVFQVLLFIDIPWHLCHMKTNHFRVIVNCLRRNWWVIFSD
jgi:hypothetical protein